MSNRAHPKATKPAASAPPPGLQVFHDASGAVPMVGIREPSQGFELKMPLLLAVEIAGLLNMHVVAAQAEQNQRQATGAAPLWVPA